MSLFTASHQYLCKQYIYHMYIVSGPQWDAADAEIKVPSVENPELTNVDEV